MKRLLIRLAINAAAIWSAAYFIDGVTLDTSQPVAVAAVAIVFGLVNALLKPIVKVLSFPFVLVTLGIFALVINAALFGLTAYLTSALTVSGFWPALFGSLAVSLVSWLLGMFLDGGDDDD